jgi:hypothetical protein
LKIIGFSNSHRVANDSHSGLNVREGAIAEDSFCETSQSYGFAAALRCSHDGWNVLFVEFVNIVHFVTERQQRGDDAARAGAED